MTKHHQIAEPVRDGNEWVFPNGRRLPVVSGAEGEPADPPADPATDPADPPADQAEATIVVPENLNDREAVDDEALTALEAQLVAEFEQRFEAGDRDVAAMTELADAIQAVRDEQESRATQDAADAEALAALRERVNASNADPDPGDDDDDDDGDPPADPPADPAPDGSREPVGAGVTASAPPPAPRRAPSARAIRRTAPTPTPPATPSAQPVSIVAAAEVPTFANGQQMTISDVAKGLHERARGLGNKSPRQTVAVITRPNLPIVHESDAQGASAELDALVAAATAQGAQGLVAAGGWCLPSQTYLEFFGIEGADSLFDLPMIGIDGGGIMVPSFIGFDAADQALWTWTEDTDVAALTNPVITNLAVAGNVLTVDTDDPHGLMVGDTVTIHTSTAAFADVNGQTVTVASVTDADTFTAAFTHANIASAAATGTVQPSKPCMRIPCPTWTDYRLEAEGLCITHGNLTDRAFPQLGARFVSLAQAAHERRMRRLALGKVLATIEAADQIDITDGGSDSVGEVLSAIDLAVIGYKEQYGMGESAVLEAVFPLWVRENLRAALARRAGQGVTALDVSNADVTRWFTDRNVRPQFVRDYQPLMVGGVIPLAWPTEMEFVIYPAGGYFIGTGGEINLGTQRDSTLNATNDFTLAWSEEFYLVGQRGPDGRRVTVALDASGVTACCPAA